MLSLDQSRGGDGAKVSFSAARPLALRSTCPRLHSSLAKIGALQIHGSNPNLCPRLQAGPNLITMIFGGDISRYRLIRVLIINDTDYIYLGYIYNLGLYR